MAAIVTVSIGSNIDAERNIRRSVELLRQVFGDIQLSPVYQTEAVGFDGDDFLNLVAGFSTEFSVQAVVGELKSMEDQIGRDRKAARFSARVIDLDLLTYDERVIDQDGIQIPRDEILHNAFVLKPLSDLYPEGVHPVQQSSYRQLWQQMQQQAERIELYPLDLSPQDPQ